MRDTLHSPLVPLLTRDPITGEPLVVTRLQSPGTGVVIEGNFDLGWIGLLTTEQLAFVGAFLRNRGNVQRLAVELEVAYNTARSRLDEIVGALGIPSEPDTGDRIEILSRLRAGEITFEQAVDELRR